MIDFAKIGRPTFGRPQQGPAGAPAPLRGKSLRRRVTMFKEAGEPLPFLPTVPGEAVHCLMTGRTDLAVQLAAILGFYGKTCPILRVATLSFNTRNVSELSELLRSGRVGTLTLLCSEFFRQHNRDEFASARQDATLYPGRWRMAAARSHAKVITVNTGKHKVVMEGSANLRTNGNCEQLTVIMDDDLYAWHSRWIDDLVTRHEHEETERDARAAGPGD